MKKYAVYVEELNSNNWEGMEDVVVVKSGRLNSRLDWNILTINAGSVTKAAEKFNDSEYRRLCVRPFSKENMSEYDKFARKAVRFSENQKVTDNSTQNFTIRIEGTAA